MVWHLICCIKPTPARADLFARSWLALTVALAGAKQRGRRGSTASGTMRMVMALRLPPAAASSRDLGYGEVGRTGRRRRRFVPPSATSSKSYEKPRGEDLSFGVEKCIL